MTKYFERTATRMGLGKSEVVSWAEGEKRFGLNKSLFICQEGIVTQYVDCNEAEAFHEFVKNLSEEEFNKICEKFFDAINKKDMKKMHEGLAIFDEMDNYSLGTSSMKIRLLRIRNSTESKSYEFGKGGKESFIYFEGQMFSPKS